MVHVLLAMSSTRALSVGMTAHSLKVGSITTRFLSSIAMIHMRLWYELKYSWEIKDNDSDFLMKWSIVTKGGF